MPPQRLTAALLSLLLLAACRTTTRTGAEQPPPAPPPAEPAAEVQPAEPPQPTVDPLVLEMRRFEAEIERPPAARAEELPPHAPARAAEGGTLEVAFAPGATALDDTAVTRLEGLVAHLLEMPTARLELTASTDDGSGDEVERRLLRRRLEVVREHLEAAGIAAERIAVSGGPPLSPDPASPGVHPGRVFVVVRPQ